MRAAAVDERRVVERAVAPAGQRVGQAHGEVAVAGGDPVRARIRAEVRVERAVLLDDHHHVADLVDPHVGHVHWRDPGRRRRRRAPAAGGSASPAAPQPASDSAAADRTAAASLPARRRSGPLRSVIADGLLADAPSRRNLNRRRTRRASRRRPPVLFWPRFPTAAVCSPAPFSRYAGASVAGSLRTNSTDRGAGDLRREQLRTAAVSGIRLPAGRPARRTRATAGRPTPVSGANWGSTVVNVMPRPARLASSWA